LVVGFPTLSSYRLGQTISLKGKVADDKPFKSEEYYLNPVKRRVEVELSA
jgi:hypothetical protein